MRKAAIEGFSKGSVKGFYETEMTETILLSCDWLNNPAQWDRHLRRAAASKTLSVVYGYHPLTSEQNSAIEAIDDFSKRLFKAAFMGADLVEIFPWLRHLPRR